MSMDSRERRPLGSVNRACCSPPQRHGGTWILSVGNDVEEGAEMEDIDWTGFGDGVVQSMLESSQGFKFGRLSRKLSKYPYLNRLAWSGAKIYSIPCILHLKHLSPG